MANPSGQGGRDGFIVVAVLWMLSAISLLFLVYSAFVAESAPSFVVHENRLNAEALVSAALELTANRQLQKPRLERDSRGTFSFRLDRAKVTVSFRSEASRVDLNAAPLPLLSGLFTALGAQDSDAELFANQITTGRAPGKTSSDAPKSSSRQKLSHPSLLFSIPNLPARMAELVLPFVTVYSNLAQINIADAAPEVVAALPGITPELLNTILMQRRRSAEELRSILPSLGAAQQFVTFESSPALRVSIGIVFDSGYRSTAEVVILLFDQGKMPYSILTWQNDRSAAAATNERKQDRT